MPKKKTEAPEETAVKKDQYEVFTAIGGYVRTYSAAIHGPDAGKLAQSYAEKIGGSVR